MIISEAMQIYSDLKMSPAQRGPSFFKAALYWNRYTDNNTPVKEPNYHHWDFVCGLHFGKTTARFSILAQSVVAGNIW